MESFGKDTLIVLQMHGGAGAQQKPSTELVIAQVKSTLEVGRMNEQKGEEYTANDRPTAKRIRRLIEDQGFRCAMTGLELSPDDANLDHIIPVAAGGKHEMGNVQVVHKVINQMKSTLPKDEFIEWCRRVTLHADTQSKS